MHYGLFMDHGIMSGHWSGRAAGREGGGWPEHLQVTSPAADNRRRLESHLRPANTAAHKYRHIPPTSRAPSLHRHQKKTQLFLLPREVSNRAGNQPLRRFHINERPHG